MGSVGYVTFHSAYWAFAAEACLRQAGVAVRLTSVPRALSSECGTGLRFPGEARRAVETLLNRASIEVHAYHVVDEGTRGD